MPILKEEASMTVVREGVERRLVHATKLMMVVIDFKNGPWHEPEPWHHHVHEQATYVAHGEIIFYCEGEEEQKLKSGDMFWVHSNKKHRIKLLSKQARLIDSFNP